MGAAVKIKSERLLSVLVLLLSVVPIYPAHSSEHLSEEMSRYVIHEFVDPVGLDRFRDEYRAHIKRLRLDEVTAELREQLQRVGILRLPTLSEIKAFVAQTSQSAANNTYLNEFLSSHTLGDFAILEEKLESEGRSVVPSVIAYGILLQRLTHEMRLDAELFRSLSKHWTAIRTRQLKNSHYGSFFNQVKTHSVALALKTFFLQYDCNPLYSLLPFPGRSDCLHWDYGRELLKLNIFEAEIVDTLAGSVDNAHAAKILRSEQNLPGSVNAIRDLSTGPTRWSSDRQAALMYPALPSEYADLYGTWNLAFVTREFSDYPFFWMKLLIPQVGGHRDTIDGSPGYIHNRSIALFCHIHFYLFGKMDDVKSVEWRDPDLVSQWGELNRLAADRYDAKVKSRLR